jgi:hypothetical protein
MPGSSMKLIRFMIKDGLIKQLEVNLPLNPMDRDLKQLVNRINPKQKEVLIAVFRLQIQDMAKHLIKKVQQLNLKEEEVQSQVEILKHHLIN